MFTANSSDLEKLPGYYAVVKEAITVGELRRKVARKQYCEAPVPNTPKVHTRRSWDLFWADAEQMANNCIAYRTARPDAAGRKWSEWFVACGHALLGAIEALKAAAWEDREADLSGFHPGPPPEEDGEEEDAGRSKKQKPNKKGH